jgi:hypothetical protein
VIQRLRTLDARRVWDLLLILVFLPGVAFWAVVAVVYPIGIGSHANIYTEAAAAWLRGSDPWLVGPPAAIFAGPPTMLIPFVPFTTLPIDVTRLAWFVGDLLISMWILRRLRMSAYWLAFPPLFSAIVLGHIEVLVLAAIVAGGAFSGLAAVIKPYAALPLIAERRWGALVLAGLVVAVTFPLLPWPRFFAEYGTIEASLARQDVGDSVFGQPLLMVVAAVALLALGPRRALWLAVPLLWPHAQPIYKSLSIPMLTPLIAFFWALPFEGATLVGVVVLAALITMSRRRKLPAFLAAGIEPVAAWPPISAAASVRPSPQPIAA